MAYEKQNFQDGQCLCGHHLNHIEEGIVELEKKVDNGGGSGGSGTVTSVNGIEPDENGNVAVPVSTIEAETTEDGVGILIMNSDGTGKLVAVKNGKDGADGSSPTITVEDIEGGHRLTIRDISGTTTFDVMDGENSLPAVPTSVDLSGFESGTVVETYSDGSTNTYTFTFDSDGNPTKITDGNGNETVLTW